MKYATIDIETTGLNRYKDEITWIGIGLCKNIDSELECEQVKTFNMSVKEDVKSFKKLIEKIREKKLKTIFQNGKFDTLFIEQKYGIKIPISDDVMLMGTAYDLSERHGLKAMAQTYLKVEDWDISKKEKLSGKDSIVPYLQKDVRYTWELYQFFRNEMTSKQVKIYKKLLKPAYLMYRDVERQGIYIDLEKYEKVKKEYEKIEKDKLQILKSKYDINWNSSQQKQQVLFEKEKLPTLKRSQKTGLPSAGADVLKRLASKGYELPQQILDYAAYNTMNKMFLVRWGEDASYDGRIHPTFNLTNVITGRTSCTDPNLQQVPRNKDLRSLFTAPERKLFFEADYSQLELRIAADYANETTMLKIYEEGGDIHTETAKTMTAGREPTKEERSRAKAINFGFLYGMSAKGFVDYAFNSYGVTFTLAEAEHYRDLYFAKYSKLLKWHKDMEIICELEGGVSNRFGRFRKLPKIYSGSPYERSEASRRAINTPVQGTGSDLLISAATQINKELRKEGVIIGGTVHDSIVGEFYEKDKDWVVDEIRRIMCHPKVMDDFGVEFKVKLEVDVGVGPWGSK